MNQIELSDEYDIVILGAGPAGCMVAKNISENYDVLLLDKSKFPRVKVCGGALLEKSTAFLNEIELKPPEHIFARPKSMSIRYFDWDNDVRFEQKRNFLNVHRDKFDYWLLEQSLKKINFSPETKLSDFKTEDDGLTLHVKKQGKIEKIKTKYLVDGSGSQSLIRKKFGKHIPFYVAVQYWIKAEHDDDTLDYILSDDITDYYIWIIPKDDFLLVGAALKPNNVREKVKLFRKKIEEKLNLPTDAHKSEAWTILRPDSLDNIFLTTKNILLVGESAGLISASTGEGISFALRSGYFCGDALNENFESPYESYIEACTPLLDEVQEKIDRAKIYKDPSMRLKFFPKS